MPGGDVHALASAGRADSAGSGSAIHGSGSWMKWLYRPVPKQTRKPSAEQPADHHGGARVPAPGDARTAPCARSASASRHRVRHPRRSREHRTGCSERRARIDGMRAGIAVTHRSRRRTAVVADRRARASSGSSPAPACSRRERSPARCSRRGRLLAAVRRGGRRCCGACPRAAVPALVLGGTLLLGAAARPGRRTRAPTRPATPGTASCRTRASRPYALRARRTRRSRPSGPTGCSPRRRTGARRRRSRCPGGARGADDAGRRARRRSARPSTARTSRRSTRRSPRRCSRRRGSSCRRGARTGPMQLLGLLAVLGTTVLLLRRACGVRRATRAGRRCSGWCPFVAIGGGDERAHRRVGGVARGRRRPCSSSREAGRAAGSCSALAIATKLLPVLVAPPLLRRRPCGDRRGASRTVVARLRAPRARERRSR